MKVEQIALCNTGRWRVNDSSLLRSV